MKTNTGRILAGTVVYAAGYESQPFLDRTPGSLKTTYAVTSTPIARVDGWPDGCLVWETARPYFYARQTPDGRAMIGGGDTAFAEDHTRETLTARKIHRLRQRFEQLFPAVPFIPEFAWGGTFAGTKDGLAYIGQPPGRPNTFFALGFGGNGITFGIIAARLIADLFLGRPNPDAEIYRFGR